MCRASFTFLIVILMAVVPVFGIVEFTGVVNGDGAVKLSYQCTEGERPRGVALLLSCDGTVTIDGLVSYDCFNVCPDNIYDDPSILDIGEPCNPLADPMDPGVAELPATEVSVCMVYLDEGGNQEPGPEICENVITLSVSGIGGIMVSADTLRGPDSGVVGSELASNLPIWFGSPPPDDCMADTNPDYATWDSQGKPCCWCCEYQCRGDANCDKQFGILQVYTDDLVCLIDAYGKPVLPDGCAICADFDHQMQFGVLRVYTDDLAIFVNAYGQPTVLPCSEGLPNSDFNFWTDEECDPDSPLP